MSEFVTWQINVGQIFEVITLVGGYIFIGIAMNGRVTNLEADIKQLSVVVTKLAVQHQRLDRIEEDMREMRHGQGFVVNPPHLHGHGKS